MRTLDSKAQLRMAERSAMQQDFIGYVLERGRGQDQVWLAEPGSLLIVAPDQVRTVLITEVDAFRKSKVTRLVTRDYVQGGVILAEGAEHARQRRLMAPAFTSAAVEPLAGDMVARARAEVATWADGEVVDVDPRMAGLALAVVSRALFGVDIDPRLHEAVRSFELTLRDRLESIPWTGWNPGDGRTRLREAVAAAHSELSRTIALRRARGELGADLLAHLLTALDDGDSLSERELLDQCVTLFFAGHGTTSRALAWTLAVLAQHPDWWARVEAEADSAEDGAPTPVIDRVLSEAMRLYPPAWLLDREAIRPVQVGDTLVEPGTTVLCCAMVTQRDARYWRDPDQFDPDRWLPDGEASRVHRLAYFPFSAGVRTCPGRGFALLEARLVLREIARTVRLHHAPPGRPLRSRAGVTMSCWGGMPMRVERR